MIVWGFRSRNKVYGQAQFVCSQCHQHSYHSFVRTQRWFTLFFIPVFPFSTTYISRCNMCGIQLRVPKEKVEALFAPQQQPPLPVQAVPSQPEVSSPVESSQLEASSPVEPSYYEQNLPPRQ